jgi:hypothetical protein
LTLKRMGDLDTSPASAAVDEKQTKKLKEAPFIWGKQPELISTDINQSLSINPSRAFTSSCRELLGAACLASSGK